jgi:hypothetical protein
MKIPKIHKGLFFYELQIWFFVLMYQHDMSYDRTSQKNDIFRWGSFFIWWDSVGFNAKYKFIKRTVVFYKSLKAFLKLSSEGFEISYSESDLVETFQFSWDGSNLNRFPLIGKVANRCWEVTSEKSIPLRKRE